MQQTKVLPQTESLQGVLGLLTHEAPLISIEKVVLDLLTHEALSSIEETEAILMLLALRLEIPVEAVPSVLYHLKNQAFKASGKANYNKVMATPEAAAIEAVFKEVGRMKWHSFVKNRLPLLKLPEDILEAVRRGQLAYSKAIEVARVKEAAARRQLLETAMQDNLSLTQIRAEIQALQKAHRQNEAVPVEADPWQRLQQLSRSANQSKAFDDPQKERQIIDLLDELENLLKD